ncbi:TSHB: Thyrotropin subunit beta, partial [Crotalus adamanteus]
SSDIFFCFIFISSMNPVLSISLPLIFALTLGQSLALCIPVDYVIHVEKRECGYCLAINTTICEGFCMTWPICAQSHIGLTVISPEFLQWIFLSLLQR